MSRRAKWLVMVIACSMLATAAWAGDGERLFPLRRQMVGDRELPNPMGIGATLYYQQQKYDLKNLVVTIPMPLGDINAFQVAGVNPTDLKNLPIDNWIYEANLKLDLWVLPFLNVFGLLGYIEGETEVRFPLSVYRQVGFNQLVIDYDGPVYGAGATLVGGYKSAFASLTAVYTYANPSTMDSTVKSLVLMPRIGVNMASITSGVDLTAWLGAMYQEVDERDKGDLAIPVLGKVKYDADLEQQEPWSYLLGLSAAIGKHWAVEVEGGMGARQTLSTAVTYRF